MILKRAPYVDLVVGPGQLAQVPELIDEGAARRASRSCAVSLGRTDGGAARGRSAASRATTRSATRRCGRRRSRRTSASRSAATSSARTASCPSVRGPEQSRPPEHIVAEVAATRRARAARKSRCSARRSTATATTHGEPHARGSATCSPRCTTSTGIERIKFVTNYPKDMTDDLLDAVRDLPKVVQVPARAGAERLRRGAEADEAATRSRLPRDARPLPREGARRGGQSATSSSASAARRTRASRRRCDLVRECRFKNSFIFKYSERAGTKAAERYPDDVPEEVKKRRNNELLAIQNENSRADHRAQSARRSRCWSKARAASERERHRGRSPSRNSPAAP